jgi:hypothetical protein
MRNLMSTAALAILVLLAACADQPRTDTPLVVVTPTAGSPFTGKSQVCIGRRNKTPGYDGSDTVGAFALFLNKAGEATSLRTNPGWEAWKNPVASVASGGPSTFGQSLPHEEHQSPHPQPVVWKADERAITVGSRGAIWYFKPGSYQFHLISAYKISSSGDFTCSSTLPGAIAAASETFAHR